MRRLITFFVFFAVTPAAFAIGTVTDGDATFSYVTSFDNTSGKRVQFIPGTVAGFDVGYQIWWWVAVDGAAEQQLPTPSTESYVGDTATLGFQSLGGVVGLNASLVGRVSDGAGPDQAAWLEQLAVSNQSGGPVTLSIFHYADVEVGGTFEGDEASFPDPGDFSWVRVSDPAVPAAFLDYRALGPTNYEVLRCCLLRDLLNDGSPIVLLDTGVPFGPGDFSGIWEWRSIVLADGSSATLATALGVDESIAPGDDMFKDGFESAD